MSRIQNIKNDTLVEDKFPYEYLFAVTTQTPWFVDITNYLVTGKLPSHLYPQGKRKIIQESTSYSRITNELYKTDPDVMIRRCAQEDKIPKIIKARHDEPCGGYFADNRKTIKSFI